MKSLTLQFIAVLPLLSLLLLFLLTQHSHSMVAAAAEGEGARTTSAHINKRSTSTTTQQPPSLRAPRLMRTPRPTTVMTHPTTRTKTTTTTVKPTTTHTVPRRVAPNVRASAVTPPPAAHRPTRGADESAPTNVRPNRSFLSAAATQGIQNGNADAVAPLGRSAAASKTSKQIDNRQIKRAPYKSNNNAGQQQQQQQQVINTGNYQNANDDNVARTSAVASETKVPATASLSPTVTSPPTASSGAARLTSSIDSKASDAMTNHYNQPPLQQRQSKQIASFAARTNVQRRETPTLRTANHGAGTANSTRLPQTPKSPRMIHRLVAGHIQNAEGRSTYQVSAISANSTISNSTTHKPTYQYVRTKGGQLAMSSSYRLTKVSTTAATPTNTATTTTATPTHMKTDRKDSTLNEEDNTDDEALLEDDGDFDNWDNGILRLSAGSGKENNVKSKKSKDESKKTLSDQVRDGKYGLIEQEIFRRPPKRPGVISYLPNKETPLDNERTFGGLNEEDIWLAEDHLLVIKGGNLNEGEPDEPWPPIDDYDAPGRQIKIPPHPKVPPPFPVQLEENGPLQFIGNNKFTVVYPIANESIPVYPAGAEANFPSSESDGDNEKNLLTRPGTAQDVAQGEPGYNYPAPSPPWLYHNQTFVNPFLNNARPITFPNLGPFPLAHNGSLDNSNGTDYFDEDDPSLYYPPAYTFVYKSNYTNPVPPGPLVPGIVLPPPANQFSRLEKPERVHTPSRNRGYGTPPTTTSTSSTTTSTTTTSTTTTSTTTEAPYRPKVITKIHQYSPKTIVITPEPPRAVQHVQPSKPSPPPAPTPTASPPEILRAIPVPVAVHIPIFPSHKYPQPRPNAIAYEATTPRNNQETLSKSNPIYYEYFEAKRQPNGVTTNVIDDFLSTTEKPVLAKPIKLYATSKRPFKSQPQNQRNFLAPQLQPQRPYLPQDVVYITPKPEPVRYKRPLQVPIEPTVYKPRPLENFEEEVNAIRETLRYYQNQQLRDNNIPRTPKAKPLYEFNFDATKNLEPAQPTAGAEEFQPPVEYDEAPFKPMVTYSPPVDDENSFHAINVEKSNAQLQQQQQQQQQEQYSQQQQQQPRYQSTTTLVPIQPDTPYHQIPQGRSKKLRLGAKYLQQTPILPEYRSAEPELRPYPGNQRTHAATQAPWPSLNQQQELNEYSQPPQYQRIERPPPAFSPKQRAFNGYYYGGPTLHARQNNRFYEEPFQQRRVINYRQPPPPPPPPQPNYAQQQQQQPQTLWSLENDTYVNYAPNRPPLNPDAEYINPYQPAPFPAQLQRYTAPQQRPGPALSHQSQYYAPPQLQQQQPQQQQQQLPPPRQYQQPQIPLHRDILVNYRQPLPPINPDSEYISHPQVVRPQAYSPIYRSNGYQRLPPQLTATGEQDGLYYIAPKYRRSNNSNGNGRSNNENSSNNNSSEQKNNSDANGSSTGNQSADNEGGKPNANANANTNTKTSTPTRGSNGNVNH